MNLELESNNVSQMETAQYHHNILPSLDLFKVLHGTGRSATTGTINELTTNEFKPEMANANIS